MNRPLTITTLAFLCLGIVLPASDAVGQQKTLKELIVGTWLLDSVYDQAQDGRKNEPWGPNVKGIVMFDGNGRFSFQIISADRSKSASNNPRSPVGQAVGYFGTYTVDEAAKTVTTTLSAQRSLNGMGSTAPLILLSPRKTNLIKLRLLSRIRRLAPSFLI